jgi:hypothetical protein
VKQMMMALFAVTLAFTGVVNADPDRPQPLKGVLMPFPWENIGGVWEINDPSLDSIFSFEVKTTQEGRKVLEVTQVHEKSGEVIATGAGVAIPGDKNTISVMMAGEGEEPYMLYVRHIREKKYSRRKHTVLTIKKLTGAGAAKQERNYYISRVSSIPYVSEDEYWKSQGY